MEFVFLLCYMFQVFYSAEKKMLNWILNIAFLQRIGHEETGM